MLMKMLTSIAVTLLFSSGVVSADTIYLKGGGTLEGEVLEIGDDAVVISLEGLPGSRLEVPLFRVSEFGLYRIKRSRVDAESAPEREALGDWAFARGLFGFAHGEYSAARRIAGELASEELKAKLELTSSRCGDDKLERAERLVEQGLLEEALLLYRDIQEAHPNCPASAEAKQRAPALDRRIAHMRREEQKSEAREKGQRGPARGVEAVEQLLLEAERQRREGHRQAGNLARAEDAFLRAIEFHRRAAELLRSLKNSAGDGEAEKSFSALEAPLSARLIDAYVDLGHHYVLRGNLIRASRYAGLALAIDPNAPRALSLREVIGTAAASDRFPR